MNVANIIQNADEIWKNIRWGEGIKCPKCSSSDYYVLSDGRYKCKHCGKIYSDTTDTLLHHSKVEKWKWLWTIYKMSNSKGISNIELSKDIDVNVKTAWLMQQKIRYAMDNKQILSGDIAMDECYVGGWTNMHLKKKMKYMADNNFLDNGRYTKSTLLAAVSKKKQHVISMVDAEGHTIVLHTPNPITKGIVEQVLKANTSDIRTLITDESKLYQHLKNVTVEQSNHSKGIYVTKGGYSSNVVENRFSWLKRKIEGIYTHTTEKYLQLYLNQIAFAANHKDDTKEERFKHLLKICTGTYVRTQEIYDYDHLSQYDFIDVYAEEERMARDVINSCSIIQSVETKHHVKIHR